MFQQREISLVRSAPSSELQQKCIMRCEILKSGDFAAQYWMPLFQQREISLVRSAPSSELQQKCIMRYEILKQGVYYNCYFVSRMLHLFENRRLRS